MHKKYTYVLECNSLWFSVNILSSSRFSFPFNVFGKTREIINFMKSSILSKTSLSPYIKPKSKSIYTYNDQTTIRFIYNCISV